MADEPKDVEGSSTDSRREVLARAARLASIAPATTLLLAASARQSIAGSYRNGQGQNNNNQGQNNNNQD
jgi:hypothetical protein